MLKDHDGVTREDDAEQVRFEGVKGGKGGGLRPDVAANEAGSTGKNCGVVRGKFKD